ncbi:MAG TPA: hypothetical protein VLF21_01880 [Candidatus Saccharimonadales bacterium]|nr:hypothetical protein [Candidatus Saccharimonadales bacterium]
MFENLHDKVGVLATFSPQSKQSVYVRPYLMQWKGRRYKIDVMGGHHFAKRGQKRVLVCGFSSGSNDFTLEFDPETFEWTLVEVFYGS